jgi:hypothetical protein
MGHCNLENWKRSSPKNLRIRNQPQSRSFKESVGDMRQIEMRRKRIHGEIRMKTENIQHHGRKRRK